MPISSDTADLEAYRLMRAGNFRAALPFAERAVSGKRRCVPAHGMLASILLQLGRAADAESLVSQAENLETGTADAYDGLAFVSLALRAHERANRFYRRATELAPQTPRFWYNLACSERSLGRLAEAEAACDRAIALDPAQYPSYLLRSELRVQASDANHVSELQTLLARPDLEYQGRLFVGYALAKELDDLHRFDEAFRWFSEAARSRRSRLQYDVAADELKLRRIAEVYSADPSGGEERSAPHRGTTERSARESPAGSRADVVDSSRYIFIVGLPRSGTTLVERILTGLPEVASNGETENFSRSLLEATAPGSADVFERAASAAPGAVAEGYARRADGPVSSGRIVEKLPLNYLYVGAIRRALPEAKILLLRRSPLDSCFAMYRTLFREAYPFTYDFEELARYYAAYERLMRHWQAILGEQLHEIVYEELVREPQRLGADMARHCGLRWCDAAIDIQKNAAVSLTASASQIRRPIYGTSSGRWRHYQPHLQGLIDALRRYGVALPPYV
jgi:tetratricopeptide (TPR) repeat protein